MTDQDRYGQKLGKRFYAVRGILCSPEAGERGPLAVATYMLHHFKKQLPELKNLYGSAARAIANGGGIFGLRHELGEIERRGNGSLAATHFFLSLIHISPGQVMTTGQARSLTWAQLSFSFVTSSCLRLPSGCSANLRPTGLLSSMLLSLALR